MKRFFAHISTIALCLVFVGGGCVFSQAEKTPETPLVSTHTEAEDTVEKTDLALREMLALEHDVHVDDIEISLEQHQYSYARGVFRIKGQGIGNTGTFFATNKRGGWIHIFSGDGPYSCHDLTQFGFPADMTAGCDDSEE